MTQEIDTFLFVDQLLEPPLAGDTLSSSSLKQDPSRTCSCQEESSSHSDPKLTLFPPLTIALGDGMETDR